MSVTATKGTTTTAYFDIAPIMFIVFYIAGQTGNEVYVGSLNGGSVQSGQITFTVSGTTLTMINSNRNTSFPFIILYK